MNKTKTWYSSKTVTVVLIILNILWIAFIFTSSLKNAQASSSESAFVTDIINSITQALGMGSISEGIIRTLAHFTEFVILGSLQFVFITRLVSREKAAFLLPLLGLSFPFADETLQYLSPGRVPDIADMWVDFAGYCIGCVIVLCAVYIKHRICCKRKEK